MVSNRPDLIQPLLSLSPTKKVPDTLSPECRCSRCASGSQSTFYWPLALAEFYHKQYKQGQMSLKVVFFYYFDMCFKYRLDSPYPAEFCLFSRWMTIVLSHWTDYFHSSSSPGPNSLRVANCNETSALWEIPSAKFCLCRSRKISVRTLTGHTGVTNLLLWTKQRLSLISPYRVNPGFSG